MLFKDFIFKVWERYLIKNIILHKTFNIYKTYIFILFYIFFDFFLLDDEPLWEPLEWSLVQTWLLYVYLFSWITENLQTSKFGSFTSRDKKVYIGLFKSWWFIQIWLSLNIVIAGIFVITPFFFELNYYLSNLNSFWVWLSRNYFFKIASYMLYIVVVSNILLMSSRWLSWKFQFFLSSIILFFLVYVFFFITINCFFCFFSDYFRYKNINWINYFTVSKGPQRWGYGVDSKYDKDRFNYHKTPWKFWYKNDSMYSSMFIILNMFILISTLFLIIKYFIFLKYLFLTRVIYYTYVSFISYSTKLFANSLFLIFTLNMLSIYFNFIRFPFGFFNYNNFKFIWSVFINSISNYLFNAFH